MQQKKVHANTALTVLRSSQHACTLDFMVATQFHFIMYVAIIINIDTIESSGWFKLSLSFKFSPQPPSSNRGIWVPRDLVMRCIYFLHHGRRIYIKSVLIANVFLVNRLHQMTIIADVSMISSTNPTNQSFFPPTCYFWEVSDQKHVFQ